jgi:hypothetical protein
MFEGKQTTSFDKNIFMKRINKIEKILLTIALIGIILRLFKLSSSGTMTVTSIIALAILYWVYAFYSFKLWKSSISASLINFTYYFFLSFMVCAILYLIIFWPGGHVIVYQGFKLYLFVSLFAVVFSVLKYKENKTRLWIAAKTSFMKFSIVLLLGLILSSISDDIRIKLFASDPLKTKQRIESFNEKKN